ncbi:MAG: hypothetical protein CVU87_01200 [Firmicutes bacterium HGW-Firmicutes-12]|nr:MAG: hypothetical protein CVU87_01200 [Firmicutes bacterium HGW-Firmicutes-12]
MCININWLPSNDSEIKRGKPWIKIIGNYLIIGSYLTKVVDKYVMIGETENSLLIIKPNEEKTENTFDVKKVNGKG